MTIQVAQLSGTYLTSNFPKANYTAPWHYVNTTVTDWILPHSCPVEYTFNSYGYRGTWTDDDLANAIWCFGDSQTFGLGVDNNTTWAAQLEHITNSKTINFGIAGASNDTIARTLLSALHFGPKPKAICVLLTDSDRRETITNSTKISMFPQVHTVLPTTDQHLFRHYIESINETSNQINYDKNLLLIQAYTKDIPTVIADFTRPMWETAQTDPAYDGYHIGHSIHKNISEYFGNQLS